MDNKEDHTSKLASFDINIEKINDDDSEALENDFDDHMVLSKKKKINQKKLEYLFFYLF